MRPTTKKNQSIFKKKYCPNQFNSRGCNTTTINSNRTVYVNITTGTSQGRLGNPACPFRTINQAINSVRMISRTIDTQWLIIVGSGSFNENVEVPAFVNLEGAGCDLTNIRSLSIDGTCMISKLAVINNELPLVRTQLNHQDPDQNQVNLSEVKIMAETIADTQNNAVISINGDGLNNRVKISNSVINAKVNRSNPSTSNQILFDVNAPLVLNNVNESFYVDYKATASQFNLNDSLTIKGGEIELIVTEGPAEEVNVFRLASGGASLSLYNNLSRILVLLLREAYKADVSFIKAHGGVSAIISNSTTELDGVSRDYLNLVDNLSAETDIEILGLTTPRISIPRLKGNIRNIKYTAISGNGDIIASGGLSANIVKVTQADYPDLYILQPNDQTVISDGANVGLFDPSLAFDVVTDKGKFVTVRNIGTNPITITSDNNKIYDGDQTLQSSQSITLQHDSMLWYIIGN